ncbi:MAG: hypothetical protein WBD37_04295, partial [Anderseniella sp.]
MLLLELVLPQYPNTAWFVKHLLRHVFSPQVKTFYNGLYQQPYLSVCFGVFSVMAFQSSATQVHEHAVDVAHRADLSFAVSGQFTQQLAINLQ